MSTPTKRAPRKPRMSEHSRFLATLADLAKDPAVSPDKLGQVIDAHDRFTAREAVAAYNAAFVAAQKAIPAVVRDATNDLTMSRYARLETVSMAVDPVILAHGLSISFATGDSGRRSWAGSTSARKAVGWPRSWPARRPAMRTRSRTFRRLATSTSWRSRRVSTAMSSSRRERTSSATPFLSKR